MADEKIVGRLDDIQGGSGNVLIIRASGEQVVAKPGDAVLEGDTIVTAGGAKAIVSIDDNGNKGVVSVDDGASAKFDNVLFDQVANLIPNSSQDDPVNVGEKVSVDVLNLFNEQLPSAGIRTANEDSQSDRVVDGFNVQRSGSEEIPDAGTPTTFGRSLSGIEEVLPGDGFNTGNEGDGRREVLPTDGVVTDNQDDPNDVEQDEPGEIPVSTTNPIPIQAFDDSKTGTEDQPVTINVLSNDSFNNTNVTITFADGSQNYTTDNGTVTVNGGQIIYTPNANFNGTETFTYTITNNVGDSSTATVKVTIDPVDDSSVLVADTDTTAEDTVLTVLAGSGDGVLDDDTDVDNTLSVTSFTVNGTTTNAGGIANIANVGALQLNSDGGYVFTPATNFNGKVPEVTYTTNTGSSSTLNINVTPVDDDAPDAIDDTFATNEDTPVSGNVLTNTNPGGADTGVDHGKVISNTNPLDGLNNPAGTVVINENGDFTYTPLANFNGPVTFTYTVEDDEGQTDTATVTINVTAVDDPTSASPDTGNTNEDTTLTVNAASGVLSNDTDIDSVLAVATFSIAGGASNVAVGGGAVAFPGGEGTIELNADGSYEFIPAANYNGSVPVITYTTNTGATSTLTITINPVDDGSPVAAADTYSTPQDTAIVQAAGSLTANDTLTDEADIDVVTNARTDNDKGTISIAADGSFTFTPDNGFNGIETFTYTLTDTDGDTATAVITLNVGGPSVTITGDSGTDDTVAENATVSDTFAIAAPLGIQNITIAGTNVSLAQLQAATSGSPFVVNTTNGALNITDYTGNANSGTVSYTYDPIGTSRDHNTPAEISESLSITTSDGVNTSAAVTLDISITDTEPTTAADTRTVTEDDTGIAGNVVTGTNASADTIGGDTTTVTGVATGNSGSTELTTNVNTGLAGTYGTLTIQADGSYTYVTNSAAQALAAGVNVTDTFSYTIKDSDGDFSTTTVTFTVTGVDDAPPGIVIDNEDLAVTPLDHSVTEASGSTITGDITISKDADLSYAVVTIAGQDITNATAVNVVIAGNEGTLTVTGFNAATGAITYSYVEDGNAESHNAANDNINDSFTVLVTDNEGSTTTDTLDIRIIDTAPTAVADTRTVSEDDTGITGNVRTGVNANADTDAADTTTLTGVTTGNSGSTEVTGNVGSAVSGTYGDLTINADGSYTYVTNAAAQALNNGESVTDTFSYTIKDSEGDFSTTTFILTVTGAADAPTVTIPNDDTIGANNDDLLVAENATSGTQSFTISAVDGLTSLTVGTTVITAASLAAATALAPIDIVGETRGTLQITGYNAATGVVSYTYDPTGTSSNHTGATNDILDESIALTVTDETGATANGTLDIGITDTAPVAVADTRTVSEDDTGITGNVRTGVNANADTDAADTTNVTGVTTGNSGSTEVTGNVGSAVSGTYGDLTINADGSYTYVTNAAAQALNNGESVTDTFSYTIKDSDGDFSTTTFTLTVNGAADAPTVTIPNDDTIGANNDDLLVAENATSGTQSFTISAVDGLTSLTVGTTVITAASLAAATALAPIDIVGETRGTLQITGYNAATGVVSYTYDPTGTSSNHTGATNDILDESIALTVTDETGATANGTLDIGITDTAPSAVADTRTVGEDDTGITGNVRTGVNANADTDAADTTNVTGVTTGNSGSTEVTGNVGSAVSGTYGDLTINADGSYTYVTNATAQALASGASETDTFSYTIKDSDGDFSTTTFTFTVNGADELTPPVNTVPALQAIGIGVTSLTFNAGNGNLISTTDADSDITSVVLSVTDGTLAVNSPGSATVTPSNGGATQTITGTHAQITAALAEIVYTPSTPAAASSDVLTITTTDANAFTDVDTVAIKQVNAVSTPVIGDLSNSVPSSTGLVKNTYNNVRTSGVDLDPGNSSTDDSDNNPSTTFNASTTEGLISAVTPDSVGRDASIGSVLVSRALPAVGEGLSVAQGAESVGSENAVVSYTGLIYLEAGTAYKFSGAADDGLYVELGGTAVVNTIGNAVGVFNTGFNAITIDNNATFTPAQNGYYTLEVYAANIDANGAFALNIDPGTGVPIELNAENFNVFAGIDELIQVGGQVENFVRNGSTDGGHFPVYNDVNTTGGGSLAVDVVGVSGQDINLGLLPIATSNQDVISSITISGVPNGVQLVDTSTDPDTVLTITTPGATDSYTFTPQSLLNPGPGGVVNLSSLVLRGVTDATAGLTATDELQLTIDATASDLLGSTLNAVQGTFTVGVISSTYKDNLEPAIQTVNTGTDTLTVGSGTNDEITLTGSTNNIVHAGEGNDTITGNDGANILFGDLGNDTIAGGAGNDTIFAGRGSNSLTGNSGSDVFTWVSGDGDGSTDTITDFTVGSGNDVLDLSGLLSGETPSTITDYISLNDSGGNTTLTIDLDGSTGGTAYDDLTIELTGVTGSTLAQLISNENIIFDLPYSIQGTTDGDGGNAGTGLVGAAGRDDDIFSGGVGTSQSENVQGSATAVSAGSGNDRLIFDADDTISTAPGDNSGHIRIRDFTIGDVTSDSDADTLVLGDLLRAGDATFDGTAADAVRFFHFVENSSATFNSGSMLYIDVTGSLGAAGNANRNFNSGSNAFSGLSASDQGLLLQFSNKIDVTPGANAINTEAHIQNLINLGFLDVT